MQRQWITFMVNISECIQRKLAFDQSGKSNVQILITSFR